MKTEIKEQQKFMIFADYNVSSTEDNILKGFMKDVNFKVVSHK